MRSSFTFASAGCYDEGIAMDRIWEPNEKTELEHVLMIISEDARSLAQQIAKLDSAAGYRLTPLPTVKIRDVYFDTADGRLRKRKVNLRVRRLENGHWLTLKQDPRIFSLRRDERQELEIPWSPDSLRRVLKELSSRGIELEGSSLFAGSDPVEVLKTGGLRVIQDRETQREARNITSADGHVVLAELAVDSVLYHFQSPDIRLFEVEIEAKSSEGRRVIGEVASSLRKHFGSELRPWRHGKLKTGKTIRKLLENGALGGLVNGTDLRPNAFEKIDQASS